MRTSAEMRNWVLGGALVLPALVWTLAAAGDNLCITCVSSQAQLALTGSFAFPPGLCIPAGELVPLSGNVHIITRVNPKSFVGNLQISLAGVSGIGQTSRDLYIGVGTSKRAGTAIPPGRNTFTATFTLESTNGCASVPLPLKFTLNFNGNGTLNGTASTISVGGM